MWPEYWESAKTHLSADPTLAPIIARYHGEGMRHLGNAFLTLARSVTGQQISVKAADSIWARLEALCTPMTPETVLAHPPETLRTVGLSQSKVNYLRDIALGFTDGRLHADQWHEMPDETVIAELTAIKGIGRWTAEMFLIFYLHRPDIWPVDDIGLLKGLQQCQNLADRPTKSEAKKLGENWRPYRTVATWYLWRSLDPVPVQY